MLSEPSASGTDAALRQSLRTRSDGEGVDGVIGLHLMSNYPVGRVGVRAGPVFASADGFVLSVNGKGGHAAMPHETVDAQHT